MLEKNKHLGKKKMHIWKTNMEQMLQKDNRSGLHNTKRSMQRTSQICSTGSERCTVSCEKKQGYSQCSKCGT